jgi:hypothetical protein
VTTITHSPVRVATKTEILDGELFFVDGVLVAVASKLSSSHNSEAGKWFTEACFGQLESTQKRLFDTLPDLTAFIAQHYA